jgi:ABC-type glycerol-3-phosphate transport system substrate-binding protein
MRRSRGSVAVGLAALIALTGLTACSTPTTGGDTPESDVTLTVSRWAGPQADAQQELLDQYSEETGVTIRFDAIDYGQLKQKQTLNMSTATGEYDLIYVPEAWVGEYTEAGWLTDLSDYVTDESLTGADWDFSDFTQSGVDVYTRDGALYGLPYFVQTPLVVFDETALEEAGFDAPQTWDEILEVAKHFKEQGSGIALPFRQGSAIVNIMAVLLAGNETDFFDADGALDLTNPAVVEAVAFIQELSKYGLDGSNGWHWDEVNKALQFGQAPIGITTSGLFTALENPDESNVAGQLGYAPIPYAKRPAGLLQTWGWSVPADSKNQEEAFKLGAWLTSKAAQKEMGTIDPSFISFRNSLYEDPDLTANAPWLPAVQEALATGVTVPLQPNAPALTDALSVGLSGVVANGEDPATMLSGIQDTLASQF